MTLAVCLPLLLPVSLFASSDKDKPLIESRHCGLLQHGITELALDPTGETLFVGTERGQLAAWDLKRQVFRWEITPEGATKPVIGLDVGPSRVTYITPGGAAIGVVAAATGKDHKIQLLGKVTGKTTAIAQDPSGKWTWVGMHDGVLHCPKADDEIAHGGVKLANNGVTCLALDSDGQSLAVGGEDGTIRIVKARPGSGGDERVIKAHDGPVTAIVWGRGDASIISGSQDRTIRGWRPANGSRMFTIDSLPGAVTCAVIDASGKLLAWGDDQGGVRVWDIATQKTLAELSDEGATRVGELVFFDKGKSLAGAMGQRHIAIWDLTKLTK